MSGIKHDNGKVPLGLVLTLPKTADARARVLDYGARKYALGGWSEVRPGSRYLDAALRHLAAYAAGEDVDSESGLPHLAHAIASLAFMVELESGGCSCRHGGAA